MAPCFGRESQGWVAFYFPSTMEATVAHNPLQIVAGSMGLVGFSALVLVPVDRPARVEAEPAPLRLWYFFLFFWGGAITSASKKVLWKRRQVVNRPFLQVLCPT